MRSTSDTSEFDAFALFTLQGSSPSLGIVAPASLYQIFNICPIKIPAVLQP